MLNRMFVVSSATLTSTGTAVSCMVPFDTTCMKMPTQIVVKATGQGAYVRLSSNASAATNADVLVQGGDHVVLSVNGRRYISVLSDGASSTVSIGALSTGVWGDAMSLSTVLFGAGQQGVWYDPSDSTTLFEDTAGTTPSPTPGGGALSVVGLMLDKSQGGRQALPITGWVKDSGDGVVTVNGGTVTITGATTTTRVDILAPGWAVGNLGDITINGTVGSAVGPAVYVGGGAPFTVINGSKTYQQVIASSALLRVQISSGSATFDVTSRGYVPGNHAISYNTTTARPELSARVNLLLYSEQLNNTTVQRNYGTVTANAGISPSGANNAFLFAGTGGTAGWDSYPTDYGLNGGVTQTFSVYAKAGTTGNIRISIGGAYVDFNVSTGQKVAESGITGTITPSGNNWYRLTGTTVKTNVFHYWQIYLDNAGATSNNAFLWGTQLINANAFPANTYQRIADQYTYDSSGFPRYLVFNGTASGMYTPANLNLSGTDKATVFAGVRKLNDTTGQVIAELGVATSGGWYLYPGNFTSANGAFYTFLGRGTAAESGSQAAQATPYAAPRSDVLTASGNIAGPLNSIRVSGAAAVNATASQGTGNYGSFPLNIGCRSAAATPSLFLNGYLYSLIVVGAASTAAQITSTESWINVKEGGVY